MSATCPSLFQADETVVEGSSDQKAVQALSIDPSGARMVTGGVDGVIKYWEFSGMNGVDPKPFRELTPAEGHQILSVSYNAAGSLVLCITSDARARVFDREGTDRPVEETVKGDQYIRTPENTKGHTHSLSYGEFHPKDISRFMTSSYDSTVRLWDLHTKRVGMDQHIPNLNCFKCVDARNICGGSKMHVSSAAYSSDGSQVIAGCSDGSIHLFHEKNRYGKGLQIVRSAHIGNEITGLKFLFNDTQLVSRGTDDCVNFWDLRKLKDPIRTWTDIPTVRSLSNISISPDQTSWLVMGTARGELVSIDLTLGEVCADRRKLRTPQLIRTEWNGSLNQIFSTSNDGNIFINFSEAESRNGALSFIHKKPGKSLVTIEPSVSAASVFAYEELIDSGDYRENKLGDLREVTQKIRVPKPIEIGSTDVVWSALEKRKRGIETTGDILPQADEETTKLVSDAYRKTQPEKILDFSESTGQVDKLLQQKTYCPRCGLKICTCGFMAGSGAGKFITQPIEGPHVSSGPKKFKQ